MAKEAFLLRIPAPVKEWYEAEAKKRGVSLTGLILSILWTFKEEAEKNESGERV